MAEFNSTAQYFDFQQHDGKTFKEMSSMLDGIKLKAVWLDEDDDDCPENGLANVFAFVDGYGWNCVGHFKPEASHVHDQCIFEASNYAWF